MTRARLSDLVQAFRRLPMADWYIINVFSTTSAFALGIPDMGAFPREFRDGLIKHIKDEISKPTYAEAAIRFSYANRLQLSIDRIHQLALVTAAMSYIRDEMALTEPEVSHV
jgi:hypothetical protein